MSDAYDMREAKDLAWKAFCEAPTSRDLGRSKVDAAVAAALEWQSQQAQGDNIKPIADAVKHLNDWLSMDLCECEGPGHSCGATQIRNTIEGLEKLLNAPPAPSAVPEGYALVPTKASPNMRAAASQLFARKPTATPADYYAAMLAAAPQTAEHGNQ